MLKKGKIYNKIIILASLVLLFYSFDRLNAAVLFYETAETYKAGDYFDVPVLISSPEEAINAVSVTLSFPGDQLKFIESSVNNSIFDMWVKEPTISSSSDSLSFEGIIFNPGFSSSAGNILNLRFLGLKSGEAKLNFSSSLVLANDGQATPVNFTTSSPSFLILSSSDQPNQEAPGQSLKEETESETTQKTDKDKGDKVESDEENIQKDSYEEEDLSLDSSEQKEPFKGLAVYFSEMKEIEKCFFGFEDLCYRLTPFSLTLLALLLVATGLLIFRIFKFTRLNKQGAIKDKARFFFYASILSLVIILSLIFIIKG